MVDIRKLILFFFCVTVDDDPEIVSHFASGNSDKLILK